MRSGFSLFKGQELLRRSDLEHAIRAATEIIQQDQVIIIGSQSILGSWNEDQLPAAATMSDEVDVCPLSDDDAETLADQLDAAIGEWSSFHSTHGFYIQGVGRNTAVLPEGWQDRLVGVRNENTHNGTGLCLDPYDLCAAKLIAGREKDYEFVSALIQHRLIEPKQLLARIEFFDQDTRRRTQALSWVPNVTPETDPASAKSHQQGRKPKDHGGGQFTSHPHGEPNIDL